MNLDDATISFRFSDSSHCARLRDIDGGGFARVRNRDRDRAAPSEFQARQGRAISIAYQATVRNRSTEPVTLRRIEMQTIRTSPYLLRDEAVDLNKTIEASTETVIAFEMWAYPREESVSDDRVWLRGTAHFESASGRFTKSFSQSFREPKPVD